MSLWNKVRRWLRGHGKPVRVPRAAHTRLALEHLEDRLVPSASSDFRGIINLPAVQATYPYKGDGYSVALLDTGVNYNLPDLGGGWGKRVIAGWNFVNNTADPMDDNGHGTFVAGEIASSSAEFPGIAPDANIVALKVLDSQKNGTWANMDAGLQWVIAHRTQYNIVAVNLSLGSGNYSSDPYNLLESDIATLKAAGVFVSVASGNNFAGSNSVPGLQYPAVDPDVVSVGATWAGDYGSVTYNGATDTTTAANQIADFTQRSSNLSILAPGAWLTSDALGGGTTQYGGTSMAAAVVTGASVLLRQAIDTQGLSADANEGYILHLMQSTGVPIVDNNTNTNVTPTGLTFRQLDLKAALDAIPQRATFTTIPTQTIAPGGEVVIPLSVTNTSSPVTYSAHIVCPAALAWQIDQQLGLSTTGSYYTNKDGQNEKWLIDRSLQWYWLMPNGDFRRYAGSVAATLGPANLVATFDPTYYADPRKLWYPTYVPFPPISLSIVGSKLTVQSTSPTWIGQATVSITASEGGITLPQTFLVNVGTTTGAPIIGALPNLTVLHSQRTVKVALSATDPTGRAVTFSAHVLPSGGQTPPITAAVQGSQLSLTADPSFVGSYTVQVTANDGVARLTSTFNVTITNTPPQLATIPAQTMLPNQPSVVVPLSATDAEGDPLAFSAHVQFPDAQAYRIEQRLGLQEHNGSYYTNLWGYNEKWLKSADNQWYNLFPDGRLYRWAGTMTQTLQPANLVATLAPIFWTEPRLLWQAQPPVAPAITATLPGNQLTLQRQAGVVGVYLVEVDVSDGAAVTKQTFLLTLN